MDFGAGGVDAEVEVEFFAGMEEFFEFWLAGDDVGDAAG